MGAISRHDVPCLGLSGSAPACRPVWSPCQSWCAGALDSGLSPWTRETSAATPGVLILTQSGQVESYIKIQK